MQGNTSAEKKFKDLFASQYDKLCHYALSYMQDTHSAEDIVQETFVKIWEQKRELIEKSDIKFYLITAVRNNCISALRKQNRKGEVYTEDVPEGDYEPFITVRQHREQQDEQKQKIATALNTLPPKCKEVFLLVKLHGLSYKDAAATTGLSIKTIENQMGKAIKLLRDFTGKSALALQLIIISKNIFRLWG